MFGDKGATMQYEVEQKFRIENQSAVRQKLRALGGELDDPVIQADQYFAHPVRDFASTDEALRIRRAGPDNWVTYKGPKIDLTSKTREEIELALPRGDDGAARFGVLLRALGFQPVATVTKQRRHTTFQWHERRCEAAVDTVEGLGDFVELEFSATQDDLDQTRKSLQALVEHLGLEGSERRSYLELQLEAAGE